MSFLNYLEDFFFKIPSSYINDDKSFEHAIEDFGKQCILGVDTEFIWRNTYYPKLSLIQISTEKQIYLLDCLYLDMKKLEKIMTDKSILKIFHSIRGDSSVINNCLEILWI